VAIYSCLAFSRPVTDTVSVKAEASAVQQAADAQHHASITHIADVEDSVLQEEESVQMYTNRPDLLPSGWTECKGQETKQMVEPRVSEIAVQTPEIDDDRSLRSKTQVGPGPFNYILRQSRDNGPVSVSDIAATGPITPPESESMPIDESSSPSTSEVTGTSNDEGTADSDSTSSMKPPMHTARKKRCTEV
jgi:hypothetical protein